MDVNQNVRMSDAPKLCTTSGESVEAVRAKQLEEGNDGQHSSYVVLCPDERAKGFVRPYRDSYRHAGIRPKYPLADLRVDQESLLNFGYAKFEAYPEGSPESQGGTCTGRYWTMADLSSGCGSTTMMGRALSETYARDPKFYGSTFCCACNQHFPVEEFVWTADGQVVGS